MEAELGTICVSGEGALGRPPPSPPVSPPPPPPHSCLGWLRNNIVKFSRNTKFWQNYSEFCEISQNLSKMWQNMKLKISWNTTYWRNYFEFRKISQNLSKIWQNTKLKISWKFREIKKTKFFAATLLLHNLPSAAQFCLLKHSLLQRGNATLRWWRYMHRSFLFCHL